MFELFDYLQGTASPEQIELSRLEEERKKEKEREKFLQDLVDRQNKMQEEYLQKAQIKEEELRNLKNTQERLPEVTDQLWKERFGFSPVGKKGVGGFFQKLGAGLLEGGSRLNKDYVPIGEEAYKRASKNYEDEYKKLLGVERLEAQQYRDQGKLTQDMLNANMRGEQFQKKLGLTKDIAQAQTEVKNKAIESQERIASAKQKTQDFLAYYQAIKLKADAGDKEAKTQYQNIKNDFAKSIGMPVENVNDNMMATILSKKMDEEEKQEWLKNMGLIKKTTEKPKDPLIKFVDRHWQDESGNPRVTPIPYLFDKKTGAQIGGGQPSNIPPNATGAQKIAGNIRQTPLGSVPDQRGKYFPEGLNLAQQREIIQNTPLGNRIFGDGKQGAENEKEYNKNKEAWKTLTQRAKMTTQTVFDGIATGKTKEWQSAFLQNPIVRKFRDAIGDTKTPETIVGQNEVFALLEHVRARYGTRPAASLLDHIGQTLRSDWDKPETFAKKAGSISLMIQLAQLEAEEPRMGEYIENVFKATEKNPDTQKSLAQAFDEEIEDSLDKSQKGMRNRYPTIESVFRRLETPLIKKEDKNAKRRALGLAPIQGPVQ